MRRVLLQISILMGLSILAGLIVNAFSPAPLPLVRPPDEREGKWPILTADEVMAHIEEGSAIVVDARKPHYFAEGHIPGSLNLPVNEFGDYFAALGDSLPRDFPLIVYCQGGACDESLEVLEHLAVLDFQQLFLYKGGWMEWQNQNRPIESSEEGSK